MQKRFRIVLLAVGIALTLLHLSPAAAVQGQQNEIQRAHDSGYQHGLNDARTNKPTNLKTNDWHGDRLTAYQQGYREGYRSVGGEYGWRAYQDRDDQRAYQTGYRNGTFDGKASRPMNPNTDDWYGERLDIYRKAYEQGYRGVRGQDDDRR